MFIQPSKCDMNLIFFLKTTTTTLRTFPPHFRTPPHTTGGNKTLSSVELLQMDSFEQVSTESMIHSGTQFIPVSLILTNKDKDLTPHSKDNIIFLVYSFRHEDEGTFFDTKRYSLLCRSQTWFCSMTGLYSVWEHGK